VSWDLTYPFLTFLTKDDLPVQTSALTMMYSPLRQYLLKLYYDKKIAEVPIAGKTPPFGGVSSSNPRFIRITNADACK
jgi:hypothetical protein